MAGRKIRGTASVMLALAGKVMTLERVAETLRVREALQGRRRVVLWGAASVIEAVAVLAATGCDGVMIGRAAQGRPWIFREVNARLAGEPPPPAPVPAEVRDIMLTHFAALYALYGEDAGVRVARKHLGWYLAAAGHNSREGEAFRRRWVTLATPQEQAHEVAAFFAG